MTNERLKELQTLIARAKSIQYLPAKQRTNAHEVELAAALDVIRNEQLELFTYLTKSAFETAKQRFFVTEDNKTITLGHEYRDDIEVRLDQCIPPRVPEGDISVENYNDLIAEVENGQASVYGGYCELIGCQTIYEQTFNFCMSVYKALTMTDKNEWDSEATAMVMMDQGFLRSKIRLDNLVAEYDARLKWFQSVYTSISRQVSIKLVSEPGEMRRGDATEVLSHKKPSWRNK